jgi:NDP-sugar pyrophosphorylase family protein
MNLHIVLDTNNDYVSSKEDPLSSPETINIAGQEIIHYWLEWARHQSYSKLYIYSAGTTIDNQKIEMLQNLYAVKVIYQKPSELNKLKFTKDIYQGMGIFLDSGEYHYLKNLDDILMLEQELIHKPLHYCALIGYGADEEIQVGKNVYIHKSVKLSGAVIIGDNCVIEKDVEIENSVISSGCLIKQKSILKKSHVDQNIHMNTGLFLNNKALFESSIYDMIKKESLRHEGLCVKH